MASVKKGKSKTKKSMGRYSSIPGAGRFSKSTLDKVYKRGLGAYYSSGSRRVSAAALGFIGILIVARPDLTDFSFPIIAAAACAIFFASTK